ncbi:unnamed protein product [Closterium sp. NIES-65]|nr:unnamed protein product [Closterium sp. NIES-65]
MAIGARRAFASSARRLVSARLVSPFAPRFPTSASPLDAAPNCHPLPSAVQFYADDAVSPSGCRAYSAGGEALGSSGSGAWAQAGGMEGKTAGEGGERSGSATTHFGYRAVREEEKAELVGGVFSSVADKYDVMNDVMSGGLHRLWKDRLVRALHPFPHMHHLDVAGGTGGHGGMVEWGHWGWGHWGMEDGGIGDGGIGAWGMGALGHGGNGAWGHGVMGDGDLGACGQWDMGACDAVLVTAATFVHGSFFPPPGDIAFRVLRAIREAEADPRRMAAAGTGRSSGEGWGEAGRGARVIVCDINADMLRVGQLRAQQQGLALDAALEWVQGDAEDMSAVLADGSVDAYSIAFGIRNVTRIHRALAEAHRVLRKGGQFACLELSHVEDPLFKALYDMYSFNVIPAMGQAVTGDRESYQYLVESIRKFPTQRRFIHMMEQAGFRNVSYENMTGGVVALFTGFKL